MQLCGQMGQRRSNAGDAVYGIQVACVDREHACPHPAGADQLIGRWEARTSADGSRQDHRGQHPYLWNLEEQGRLLDLQGSSA